MSRSLPLRTDRPSGYIDEQDRWLREMALRLGMEMFGRIPDNPAYTLGVCVAAADSYLRTGTWPK